MAEKEFKNPTPAVDCIIELAGERIVLIRRAFPPLGWARPGGFVAHKRTGQRRKL